MSILRRVERQLDERLRRLFDPGGVENRGVLEIQRGILDDITAKVQPVGRGRHAFPFRRLEIHVAAPEADRPVFSVAFAGDQLASDVREALRESGCEPPSGLQVEVVLDDAELPGGFRIVYHEKPAAPAPAAVPPPNGRLVILQGQASQSVYALGASRVNIGRLAEVLDDRERLVRRNQVAFAETGDAITSTVSRAHAHIRYDAVSGEYRLHDDHSAYGTSLFRDGALVSVPAGASRGVALAAGDEIYFGQARARFERDA